MRKTIGTLTLMLALAACTGCGVARKTASDVGKNESDSASGFAYSGIKLSKQMVRSEMKRNPEATYIDGMKGEYKWNYTTGLELLSFLDVYQTCDDDNSIFQYVFNWYDGIISADGGISTYKPGNYTLDHICPGETLLSLYDPAVPESWVGQSKYGIALHCLRNQLESQPRIPDGGFWHKKAYPDQMWLDGLYMAELFYTDYAMRFESGAKRDSSLNDVTDQFVLAARHTFDPATGLYRHAYDDSRKMFWCDPVTGQSKHAWGRAEGWYMMAMADVVDKMPVTYARRAEIVSIFQNLVAQLPRYADPKTGMWYQVMDCPGAAGNYVEATCSAMFVYSMLKGIRIGVLDESLLPYARQCYERLCSTFITSDEGGILTLHKCCAVAGLGGKENRSGDYDYYINCEVVDNDPKGVAPFILASLEYEKLK
jgi:unsaturated rhamnogalacturonyl hydrolase